MDKVSFVNKISTLMKATSDDANPIQGYLYQEINKIVFESEGYCDSTLEFLVDRLNKQSCHVKFKVLKLLKYIVENGPSEFKTGLLRCSHGIREATKFSGPEDPLLGNLPNKAVRKIAQELSQLLFDTEVNRSSENRDQKKEQDKSRITGLGNANISPKGALQGFGNSPTKTKSSFMDKLSQFAGSFQDRSREQQEAILSSIESHGNYRPPPCPVLNIQEPLQTKEEVQNVANTQVKPIRHTPGKVGGDWDDDEDDDIGYQATSLSSQDGDRVLDGTENTDDSNEEDNLIQLTLNGTDDILTGQEISNFISSCQNLNCEKVVDLLNSQLKQPVVFKSLLLLEYLMNTSIVNCDYIYKTCQQHLLHLSKGESSVSSSKARKILLSFEKLLDVKLFLKDNNLENEQLLLMED